MTTNLLRLSAAILTVLLAVLVTAPANALNDSTTVPYLNPAPNFTRQGLESMFVCGFGRAVESRYRPGGCAGMTANTIGSAGNPGVCSAPNMDPAVRGCDCPPGQSAHGMGGAGYFSSVAWDTEYRWFWCH